MGFGAGKEQFSQPFPVGWPDRAAWRVRCPSWNHASEILFRGLWTVHEL